MGILQESLKKVDTVSMIKNKNFLIPKPLDALPLKQNDVSLVTTRRSPGEKTHPSSIELRVNARKFAGKPSLNHSFTVEPGFDQVLIMLLKSNFMMIKDNKLLSMS